MQNVALELAAVLVLLAFGYWAILRPWQLRWGATAVEIQRAMPGDAIVRRPTFNATRAVTINAPPENIYPWIVQMGVNRAGWYSFDVLDNLARASAETILPSLQNLKASDLIPISPDGQQGLWVRAFSTNKWMLWWDKIGDHSWVWEIYPESKMRSRLVTRVRVTYRWLSPAIAFDLLIEFFDILMMRQCLLGIRRRAEALPRAKPQPLIPA